MQRLSAWFDGTLKRKSVVSSNDKSNSEVSTVYQSSRSKSRTTKNSQNQKTNTIYTNSWFNRHQRKLSGAELSVDENWHYAEQQPRVRHAINVQLVTDKDDPIMMQSCPDHQSHHQSINFESSKTLRESSTNQNQDNANNQSFTSSIMFQSTGSLSGSLQRSKIRTNPWFDSASRNGKNRPANLGTPAKVQYDGNGQLMLEESTCSSGYGSHDSSPECSVHVPEWRYLQPKYRAEIQDTPNHVDKSINCRLSIDCPLDNQGLISDSDSDYDHPSLSVCSTQYLQSNPLKSRPPPTFHAPPPPPLEVYSDLMLADLTHRVSDLRQETSRLQIVVERAREERLRRIKDKQMCLAQVKRLHRLHLKMQNKFEMKL